jgi:hypothetical protein
MIRVFNKPAPEGQIYFTDGTWVISHAIELKEKLLACENFEEYYDSKKHYASFTHYLVSSLGVTESANLKIENHKEQKTRVRPVVGETFYYQGDDELVEVLRIEDGFIHLGTKTKDKTTALSEKSFQKEPNKYGALGILYESKTAYLKEIEKRKYFNLFLDSFNELKFNPTLSQLKQAAESLGISLEDEK